MAEVQTSTESGEMAQRFIEFVMMQAHQAALCLGQWPHPQTGKKELHLEAARMLIDQLVMIRSKTRGNLSNEELGVLNNAISSLQMAFVEVTRAGGAGPEAAIESSEPPATEGEAAVEGSEDKPEQGGGEGPKNDDDDKRRFTKSYG